MADSLGLTTLENREKVTGKQSTTFRKDNKNIAMRRLDIKGKEAVKSRIVYMIFKITVLCLTL